MYRNLSWDVQQDAYQAPTQMTGVALVLGPGLETGNAAALVVGVELELQAYEVTASEAYLPTGLLCGIMNRS